MLDGLFRNEQGTISFRFDREKLLKDTIDELRELAQDHQDAVCYMRDKSDADECADFIGYHVFIHLFKGDISEMKTFLRTKATDEQLARDYSFVIWLEEQLDDDPLLIDRIRSLVESTSLGADEIENGKGE